MKTIRIDITVEGELQEAFEVEVEDKDVNETVTEFSRVILHEMAGVDYEEVKS